jgi:hypothetical protein
MKNLLKLALVIICATLFSCKNNNTKTSAGASASENLVATSGSGDDTYIEMTNNAAAGKEMQMQSVTKMFLATNGKVRHEMVMTMNGRPSMKIIAIGDIAHPYESTELDDSAKTYTVNHIDTSELSDGSQKKITVTKIGNEKINGFNCVHAQIIKVSTYSKVASFLNSNDTTDLWASTEVPMPDAAKQYMNVVTQKMGRALGDKEVSAQLAQMGCVGFPVKFQIRGKNVSSISQITKISKDNFPANLFEVPSGYKKVAE